MRWLPSLKVLKLRRRGAENVNTFGRLARQEQRRLEQMDDPNGARRVRNAVQDVEDIVRVGLKSLEEARFVCPMIINMTMPTPVRNYKLRPFWIGN